MLRECWGFGMPELISCYHSGLLGCYLFFVYFCCGCYSENIVLIEWLHCTAYFPVAPQRDGFGEAVRGEGWAESQDGGLGQRVCPPRPDQREAGGRFGSEPREAPHLAPGGPCLSVSVCMRSCTCVRLRARVGQSYAAKSCIVNPIFNQTHAHYDLKFQCMQFIFYFLCVGSKQRSVNSAVKSRNEESWTKAWNNTGTGVVACFCLYVVCSYNMASQLHIYVHIKAFLTII